MLAILAPVPAEILADGFAVKNAEGLVAFGTGALTEKTSGAWSFEFFSNKEIENGKGELRVLIYGSKRSDVAKPHELHRPGFVTAVGIYQGFQAAARTGKHPRPNLRPQSALIGDCDYAMFWHVSDLRPLTRTEHVPLKKLIHSGVAPRGPRLILVPEEFVAAVNAL